MCCCCCCCYPLPLTLTLTPNPNPNPNPNTRKALLPLRVNTSIPGQHAASFDLLLGRASMVLQR
eukprot:scaffold33923_cov53-Phaeocystis_antarctica.AAC.1